MAKQIFMATVRGIFWAFLASLFTVFAYFVSLYLDPERHSGLVQGSIMGTGLFIINLLNNDFMERKFFKRFWHDKIWLPFSVSMLVLSAWGVVAHFFLVKVPYYQQKHESSTLLLIIGMVGAMILLLIVQLSISRWLRLRAEKKQSNLL